MILSHSSEHSLSPFSSFLTLLHSSSHSHDTLLGLSHSPSLLSSSCCRCEVRHCCGRNTSSEGTSPLSSEVMGNSDFTIDIHHGGKFHDIGDCLEYLDGSVLEDLHFELDEWSLQEIVSELQKLGYKEYAKI
ncbi:hypothetical protein PIB30_079812 [Stylosanthes scabra]|uniref:PB1-like domain-containing protein n=1 Tax=Stylosanthes scabra TaxID=79078 RepID=A0ABU6QRH0_9FABA|nr:hypothetical protein [Stylosanthes scabra]